MARPGHFSPRLSIHNGPLSGFSATFCHVPRKMVRASKPAAADGAGKRLLPRVSQHVSFQMTRQTETFPALFARVGPQVGVAPPVLPEIPGGGVTAVAVGTLKGLLSGVCPLVLHQIA